MKEKNQLIKVKVLEDFTDKNTFIIHKKGEEIEVTKERFKELGKFVKEIKNKG